MNLQYTLLLLILSKNILLTCPITIFTIHFATINTAFSKRIDSILCTFTIHFATINTLDGLKKIKNQLSYLQYTLLLLILNIC